MHAPRHHDKCGPDCADLRWTFTYKPQLFVMDIHTSLIDIGIYEVDLVGIKRLNRRAVAKSW